MTKFFLVFLCIDIYAAPIPGMGTSVLTSLEAGNFYSQWGFKLQANSALWILNEMEGNGNLSVRYVNRVYPTLSIVVQSNTLDQETSLESYIKQWIKDYPAYGFDILSSKFFSINEARGVMIDIHHRKETKQIRQVILLNKKRTVSLTCTDEVKTFSVHLPLCNQIFKSFTWRR